MNEFVSKMVKQRIDIEKEIYGLKKLSQVGINETAENIRERIDAINAKRNELGSRIDANKETLEQMSDQNNADVNSRPMIQKVFTDFKMLEGLLAKNSTALTEKLKLQYQRQQLMGQQNKGLIEMDEEGQADFKRLTEQEELAKEAGQKADRIIEIGMGILSNFDSQKSRAKRILSGLKSVQKDLKISNFTSGAISRRFEADKRLIVALFCASLLVVLLVHFFVKRR